MAYKVKLDIFEGPFDLLVYLIENAEMSIYDIQVSQITAQYMEYIEQMQKMDVAVAGEFMVLAASLIEIKSKMLLPRTKPEEGESPEDPRSELVQRLLEYKKFKAAAAFLQECEGQAACCYEKPREDVAAFTRGPEELLNLDLTQFMKAFGLFLEKKSRIEDVKKRYQRVERQRMTLEDRIQQLRGLFLSKKKFRFSELLGEERSRYHVVLTLSLIHI